MAVIVLSREDAESVSPPAGHVCISITNPRQSDAQLDGWADVLRLGFHDTDRKGGNFTVMSRADARAIIEFAHKHRAAPMTVHCQYGASRSVAVGAFLAAWRQEKLQITDDVLFPNPLVIRQLRVAGVLAALTLRDRRLFQVCRYGPMALRSEFADPKLYVPEHLR